MKSLCLDLGPFMFFSITVRANDDNPKHFDIYVTYNLKMTLLDSPEITHFDQICNIMDK